MLRTLYRVKWYYVTGGFSILTPRESYFFESESGFSFNLENIRETQSPFTFFRTLKGDNFIWISVRIEEIEMIPIELEVKK